MGPVESQHARGRVVTCSGECRLAVVAVPGHDTRFVVRHGALYLDALGRVSSKPENYPHPVKNPDGNWMSAGEARLAIARHDEALAGPLDPDTAF